MLSILTACKTIFTYVFMNICLCYLLDMTERKDNLAIFQTRLFPPHFKVVIEDTVWNLKPVI